MCQATKTVQVFNQPAQTAECVRSEGHSGYHQTYITSTSGDLVSHRWFTRTPLSVRKEQDHKG